jgi:NADH dehydrogenase/NADH:ubiquinone oxidoreductase subunit G
MIELTIDGKQVTVPKGSTVLQAAQKLGIDIPTLCHHDSLSGVGSCRVCIVEMSIEKRGRKYTWIDAACVCPVEAGLMIQTDSPKVRKERKIIIELLLSRAPDAPALKGLAKKYGAVKRFETLDKGESNCILCGLCVRVCNDLMKTGGIGTAFRGIHKKVVTPFKVASDICTGCTACAFVCPTGAIKVAEDDAWVNVETWGAKVKMRRCASCGKPFAPENYIEIIKMKLKIDKSVFEKCPECRRKIFKIAY